MATITFNIPSQHVNRVVAALKKKYFELLPFATGEGMTDPQIAKEAIRRWVIQTVKQNERNEAIDDIIVDVPDDIITGEINPVPPV